MHLLLDFSSLGCLAGIWRGTRPSTSSEQRGGNNCSGGGLSPYSRKSLLDGHPAPLLLHTWHSRQNSPTDPIVPCTAGLVPEKKVWKEKFPLITIAGMACKPRKSKPLHHGRADRDSSLEVGSPRCSPENAVIWVTLCHQGVCSLDPPQGPPQTVTLSLPTRLQALSNHPLRLFPKEMCFPSHQSLFHWQRWSTGELRCAELAAESYHLPAWVFKEKNCSV